MDMKIECALGYLSQHAPHLELVAFRSEEELIERLSQPDFSPDDQILLIHPPSPDEHTLNWLNQALQKLQLDLPVVLITEEGDADAALRPDKAGVFELIEKSQDYLNRLPLVLENTYHQCQLARERNALRQSEERYRLLSELGSDFLFTLRIDDTNLPAMEWVTGPLEKIFGLSEDDLLDQYLWQKIVAPEEVKKVKVEYEKVLNHQVVDFETQVSLPDGSFRWLRIYMRLGSDNTHTLTRRIYGAGQDITARKAAENALRESEEKYRTLFSQIPDAIMIFDQKSHRFLDCNQVALDTYGYSIEELRQMTPYDLHPPEEYALVDEKIDLPFSGKPNAYTHINRQGRRIDVEVVSQLIQYAGRPVWLSIIRDISERKRNERQIQRQIERLSSLRAVDITITTSMDLRFTLDVLLQQVITRLHIDAAQVLELNLHTQTLDYKASQGFRSNLNMSISTRLGQPFAGQAALDRRQIMKIDFASDSAAASREIHRFAQAERFLFYLATPLVAKGKVQGVLECFHRSPLEPDREWLDFLDALANQAAIAMDNAAMFEDLQSANSRLHLAYDATIEGWSRALEMRNREIEGHAQRVTDLTLQVGRLMGISDQELVHLRRGALLHDIGKLAIPDSILMKPGPLSEQEWEVMVRHPILSYEMLSPIEFLHPALDIPYCHHEKWDGSGYPRGLRGEQIPLSARVFSVVDVFDALCSDRPYQKAWRRDKALAYITQQSGRQFDPSVVAAFLTVISAEPTD
jgi:PAS domain S-box-containing protein